MKANYLKGSPGTGKTTLMHSTIVQNPGHYLIAVPRMNLADEQHDALKDRLVSQNPFAHVTRLHTNHNDKTTGKSDIPISLRRQIEEFPIQTNNMDHVALFITHASMMAADLSTYRDWHIYIDEIPNCIKSGSIKIPAIAPYLSQIINLEPIGDSGWSCAKLNSKAPSQALIDSDVCLRSLRELFSMMRGQYSVRLRTTDLLTFAGKQDKLDWFSQWDLNSLKMFKSVTLLGAGFTDSILYKAMKDDLELEIINVGNERTIRPEVKVHYFTRGHRSSTHLWDSPFGKHCIEAVGKYLSVLPASDYYWSANNSI